MIYKTNFTTNKHMSKDRNCTHAYIEILDGFNLITIMQSTKKLSHTQDPKDEK